MSVLSRTPASPRDSAARGKLSTDQHANPLGDARRFALDHGARRLGRDVARAEAGAAGGEHEIRRVAVAPREELRRDRRHVVRHERARRERVAALRTQPAIASPEPSCRSPRAPASLTVRIAIRIFRSKRFIAICRLSIPSANSALGAWLS